MRAICGYVLVFALGLSFAISASAQTLTLTVNGNPTLPVIVSWDDYAKRTFGDPWDMNQRTDIGWLTWGVDQPANGMTGKQVVDGRFRGTPANNDPNFFLLDSWFTGASKIGKNGGQFPIDLSRYTMLALKMKMATTVLNQGGTVDGVPAQSFQSIAVNGVPQVPQMNLFWSRDSIAYHNTNTPNGGSISLGFQGVAEVGIAFSPGSGFGPMQKSMEGGRDVLHTINLADLTSASSYTDLKPRSDATGWLNFGGPNSPSGWAGMADSLRIDPVNIAGLGAIEVDFVRLLAPDPANTTPIIMTWLGGPYGLYDVVLSTDPSCDDDPLAVGPQYTVVAYSQASGFAFFPQTLPAGEYYLGLRDQMCGVHSGCQTGFAGLENSLARSCSASPVRVVDAPSLTFTSPRPEGSTDDYATTQLGNAWDFRTLSDIDLAAGLSGGTVGTIPAERPSGVSLGNLQAYSATSLSAVELSGNVGDPLIYPLYLSGATRGAWNRIDTDRYRLLTFDFGVDRARDLNTGSVGRIVWHVAGEGGINPIYPIGGSFGPSQNVSTDILLRHMAKGSTNGDTVSARHVIDRFQADLRDHLMFPLEGDNNGSQSRTGWFNPCTMASGATSATTGLGGGLVSACSGTTPTSDPFGLSRAGVDAFRVDPHEFSAPTTFHIAGVTLAAHERIGGTFTIAWTADNPNPSATAHANNANWTVRLYAVPVSVTSPMTPVSRTCAAPTSGVIGDVPLSAGAASWTNGGLVSQPTSGTIAGGSLVFVCAGLIAPGGTTPLEYTFSQWPVVYDTSTTTLKPRLFMDKTALRFTAVRSTTTLTAITPAQTVTVTQVGSGSVPWTVDVRDTNGQIVDYVLLSPASGTGAGTFTVTVVPSTQLPHGFSGLSADIGLVIRLTAANAENSPQYLNMTLALYREGTITTARAFGQVDTPVHYAGTATNSDATPCAAAAGTPSASDDCVSGSIAMTGWALDDVGVSQVQIYRQCLVVEAAASPSPCGPVAGYDPGTALVLVGTASFISGARPDVEAAFPTYPNAHRAGWGFLVLTNMLPNIPTTAAAGGQGVFDFYIFAVDAEGGRTLLGRTTADNTPTRVFANNNAAAAPFGAIDFPAQGEVISGTYNNFGWVLTPHSGGGAEMDVNGGGMAVFVDGVPVGTPTYNLCRGSNAVGGVVPSGVSCNDDISSLFAGGNYRNLLPGRGAIGLLSFNTTSLSNGLHSIAWGVTDTLGRSSGIGSRFITVLNGSSDWMGDATVTFANAVGQEAGLRTIDVATLGTATGVVQARAGYDLYAPYRLLSTEPAGTRVLDVAEMDRVELALPMPISKASWDGYLVRDGRLLPLPPGTTLDRQSGRFLWQAVPGWIGDHDLLFVRQNANGSRERLPVTVSFGDIVVAPGARDGGRR